MPRQMPSTRLRQRCGIDVDQIRACAGAAIAVRCGADARQDDVLAAPRWRADPLVSFELNAEPLERVAQRRDVGAAVLVR